MTNLCGNGEAAYPGDRGAQRQSSEHIGAPLAVGFRERWVLEQTSGYDPTSAASVGRDGDLRFWLFCCSGSTNTRPDESLTAPPSKTGTVPSGFLNGNVVAAVAGVLLGDWLRK